MEVYKVHTKSVRRLLCDLFTLSETLLSHSFKLGCWCYTVYTYIHTYIPNFIFYVNI